MMEPFTIEWLWADLFETGDFLITQDGWWNYVKTIEHQCDYLTTGLAITPQSECQKQVRFRLEDLWPYDSDIHEHPVPKNNGFADLGSIDGYVTEYLTWSTGGFVKLILDTSDEWRLVRTHNDYEATLARSSDEKSYYTLRGNGNKGALHFWRTEHLSRKIPPEGMKIIRDYLTGVKLEWCEHYADFCKSLEEVDATKELRRKLDSFEASLTEQEKVQVREMIRAQ